jgi:hypothetical protein
MDYLAAAVRAQLCTNELLRGYADFTLLYEPGPLPGGLAIA